MSLMKRLIILLFFLIPNVSLIPLSSYCRFNSTAHPCVSVDIWFGLYRVQRNFPMECTKIKCPKGTYCEKGNKCWKEVTLMGKGTEMRLVDGQWTSSVAKI